ncbi:PepSY domain-containing protein [Enterovirga rhinocerotis]|uniref:Peptidase YpeB-like protein n=1 Tax=Enterovirga rhinocerotis TaxID=1339210 RepID=A0A4R7BTD2_9HYPH|nr:PepSY domain-containing protein [Enterovirga rhinocerotis]TDR88172.1 peptidase YpeB-like protein [Enterovirga rhinocerotis]
MSTLRLLVILLACLVLPATAARAVDQDAARRAMQRGEIRPLDQVLAAARAAVPGDVVSVELERKKGRWLYELKILTPAGKRREVKIDARTLAILDKDDDDDDDDDD